MVAAAMVLAAGCCAAPGAWGAGELGITVSGMPAQFIAGDTATLTATVTNLWNLSLIHISEPTRPY